MQTKEYWKEIDTESGRNLPRQSSSINKLQDKETNQIPTIHNSDARTVWDRGLTKLSKINLYRSFEKLNIIMRGVGCTEVPFNEVD